MPPASMFHRQAAPPACSSTMQGRVITSVPRSGRLIVVANRLPVTRVGHGSPARWQRSSGGLIALFSDLCRHAHCTDILTEGYDTRHQAALGNLAQVYSHLAVISAALAIDAATGGRP